MTPAEALIAKYGGGGKGGAQMPLSAPAPAPMTPAEQLIAAYGADRGPSIDFEPVEQPSQPRPPERIPLGPFSFPNRMPNWSGYSAANRVQENIIQDVYGGIPLGFGQHILAGIDAMTGQGDYSSNLALRQAKQKAWSDEAPGLSLMGNLAGGSFIGVPGAQYLMRTELPAAAKMAILGGAGGALGGASQPSGDLREAGKNTAIGMTVGGALGPAAAYAAPMIAKAVGEGASLLAKPVQAFIDTLTGPNTAAQRKLLEAIRRDGMTPEMIMQRITELGPNAAIVDAGGRNVRGLGEAIAAIPGPGAQKAETFLEERMLDQAPRLKEAIKAATGGDAGFYQTTEALIRKRSAEAKPLYDIAFDTPPIWNERLDEFLKSPEIKEALEKGITKARRNALANGEKFDPMDYGIKDFNEAGDPIISATPNMRLLDAAKRGLDDMLEQYRDKTTGRLVLEGPAADIENVRKAYVNLLDDLNPNYKVARQAWAGPSSAVDAMNLGRDFMSKDAEITAKMIRNMPESQRDFYLVGVQRALIDKVENTPDRADAVRRIFASPTQRNRIEAAFNNPEAFEAFRKKMEAEGTFSNTINQILRGSQTARREAAKEDVGFEAGPLIGAAKAASEGNWLGAITGAFKGGYNALMAPRASQRGPIADMLFDPATRAQTLQAIGRGGFFKAGQLPMLPQNIPNLEQPSAAVGGYLMGTQTPEARQRYQSRGQ